MMFSLIHYIIGFVSISLGLGLMVWSYFIGWNPQGWVVFGAGLAVVGLGSAYLWG
jgi:hypothetical protein